MLLLAVLVSPADPSIAFAKTPPQVIIVPDGGPSESMPLINPNAGTPVTCPPISRYEAMKRGGRPVPNYLNDLPAADIYKAVYRRIGGCVAPIIVRYNIGGPSKDRPTKP